MSKHRPKSFLSFARFAPERSLDRFPQEPVHDDVLVATRFHLHQLCPTQSHRPQHCRRQLGGIMNQGITATVEISQLGEVEAVGGPEELLETRLTGLRKEGKNSSSVVVH